MAVKYQLTDGRRDMIDCKVQVNGEDAFGRKGVSEIWYKTDSGKRLVWQRVKINYFKEDFEGETHQFTFVQEEQVNYWMVGRPINDVVVSDNRLHGSKFAFITDNGLEHNYTVYASSVSHMYADVVIPNGACMLRFNYVCKGEHNENEVTHVVSFLDELRVHLIPTSLTPEAGIKLNDDLIFSVCLVDAWTKCSIVIPDKYHGETRRLVFTWRNDSSIGNQPPAAISNVEIYI
jgi:hypothetical protein